MYYFRARYYASWVARWLSADPLFRENPAVYEGPKPKDKDEAKKQEEDYRQKLYSEGLNLYGYVKGNPVRFSDKVGNPASAATLSETLVEYGAAAAEGTKSAAEYNPVLLALAIICTPWNNTDYPDIGGIWNEPWITNEAEEKIERAIVIQGLISEYAKVEYEKELNVSVYNAPPAKKGAFEGFLKQLLNMEQV